MNSGLYRGQQPSNAVAARDMTRQTRGTASTCSRRYPPRSGCTTIRSNVGRYAPARVASEPVLDPTSSSRRQADRPRRPTARISSLLREMQDRVGASIIMITHDQAWSRGVDEVAVMYAGRRRSRLGRADLFNRSTRATQKALKGIAPPAVPLRRALPARNPRHGARHGRARTAVRSTSAVRAEAGMHGHNPPAKAIDARTCVAAAQLTLAVKRTPFTKGEP